MKLYTRTHVAILAVVLSLCALAAGVLVTAFVIVPAAVQRQAEEFAVGRPQAMSTMPVQFTANLAPALKPGDLTDDELNNIQIYDRANKAVVYVTTVTTQYTWFYQAVQQEGTGSGVVIDQLGHVITNYHVINGADKISIALADGSIEEAKIVGTDPENDLAVLPFNPKGKTLTTVAFGDSGSLRVGMKVLAIGNPFGLDQDPHRGNRIGACAAAADRAGVHDQGDDPDRCGDQPRQLRRRPPELPQRADRDQHRHQVSFRRIRGRWICNSVGHGEEDRGRADQVRRGAARLDRYRPDRAVSPARRLLRPGGAEGCAGERRRAGCSSAGIRGGDKGKAVRSGRQVIYGGGDIVTAVNGQKIESITDLYNALESTKPGEIATVKVVRGSQTRTLTVKLVAAPAQGQQ